MTALSANAVRPSTVSTASLSIALMAKTVLVQHEMASAESANTKWWAWV